MSISVELALANQKIGNDLGKGWSLFRSALSLEREIREAGGKLTPKEIRGLPNLRIAVWFADFYERGRGNNIYQCSWDDQSHDLARELWSKFFPDDLNRDVFLSKCWALNSVESGHGEHSGVWQDWKKCMAKAVHSYRNYREIQFGGENLNDSKWLSLLLESDTNERRDFLTVLQWLATGEKPDNIEEDDSLRKIHDACQGQICNIAWCDWYLFLGGTQAKFGIGFDDYPRNSPQDWHRFSIGERSVVIRTEPACFVSAPFDRDVEVEYCGERWHTALKEEKPTGHPVFPHPDIPFGFFIRYRAENAKDIRRNWWREADKWWMDGDEPPTLGRNQREILICARGGEDLRALSVERSDAIRFDNEEGENRLLTLRFEDSDKMEEAKVPAKIFRVVDRPENTSGEIMFRYNGDEICHFKVLPKKPEVDIRGNEMEFELETPKSKVLAFPGYSIDLEIKNPQLNRTYEWQAFFDGQSNPVWTEQGVNARLIFRDVLPLGTFEGQNVHAWSITCRDVTDGNRDFSIGSAKGLLFPDAVCGALRSAHHQCPANWTAEIPDTNPILGWIEGKSRIVLHHANATFTVLVPQMKACWWFQKQHERIDRATGEIQAVDFNGRKYFSQGDLLPELTANEMDLELCRPETPEFVRTSAEWNFVQGYWYCCVRDLVSAAEKGKVFRYNPQAEPLVWKSHEDIGFFRYPQLASVKTCLCKDIQGQLGLYITEGDDTPYDVYAISDKNSGLFVQGKLLRQGAEGPCFLSLQESWSAFCNETEGYDAILCALPHREDATGFWGALGKIGNKAQPGMCICRHAQQGASQTYGDEIGALAPILRDCASAISENHPLRSARFWNYERPPTLEATRQNWEMQVRALCNSPDGDKPEAWKKLFSTWKVAGFYPSLEGLGTQLLALARDGYLHSLFPSPDKTISDTKWLEFLQWLWDGDGAQKDIKDHLNKLGYRATAKKKEMVKEWKEHINEAKTCFFKLLDDGFPVALFPVSSRVESDRLLERQPYQSLASRFVGQLSNNVSAGELSLEEGEPSVIQFPEGRHITPAELVMSIQTGVPDDPRKEMLASLLQIMGQEGRRAVRVSGRNEWCETPTDREWLFSLASSLWLLRSQAKLEEWARTLLVQILDWLDYAPKGDKTPTSYFKLYSQMIDKIMYLPQIRERMP